MRAGVVEPAVRLARAAARSKWPLGSPSAARQLARLRLPRARLVAPCSSALPGWASASGIPATASGARARRFQRTFAHSTAWVHPGAAQGTHSMQQGKNIAWTMVALHAEDQLRQRVAWALSQIFVVSDKGGMKANEAEQQGQSALLGSDPARPLCLLRARLAALGGSALPE